jgi:RNA polymerase sigma-70 factor (ECF subfamily)
VSDRPDEFDRHRRLLFTVAYQMLGSVADAENVVQDAWLRWSAADRSDVADPRAYLVRTTSRLALDRLTAARTRRESYVGPWLPEPLLTGATPVAGAAPPPAPDVAAELGEQVSLALLVVLETLSPAERAVFVLREVFALPAAEVAATLGRSESAVRQMAHRAREHVQARQPRFDADRSAQRAVTERFLAACAGGDVDALLAALAPDVVLVSDGGGRAKAALRPISGADKVARFLLATAAQGLADPDLRVEVADLNGAPGVVLWSGTAPFMTLSLVLVDGRITQVLVVRNPDKLRGLAPGQPVRTADPSSSPGTAEAGTGRPSR